MQDPKNVGHMLKRYVHDIDDIDGDVCEISTISQGIYVNKSEWIKFYGPGGRRFCLFFIAKTFNFRVFKYIQCIYITHTQMDFSDEEKAIFSAAPQAEGIVYLPPFSLPWPRLWEIW